MVNTVNIAIVSCCCGVDLGTFSNKLGCGVLAAAQPLHEQ
jgi:hypothetical protein